jgi:A-macroglobulin receptor binding domain
LYLGTVTPKLESIEVEAIKIYDVKEMKNSVVKVYDYYEPGG